MNAAPPPIYTRPAELAVQREVPLPACTDCGAPTRPVTDELLKLAFGKASESTATSARRCVRCRRRRLQLRMMTATRNKVGKEKTP